MQIPFVVPPSNPMTPPTQTTPPAPLVPAVEPKLRADAERNREAVLAAARKRFAEEGGAARIEDIARDAGVGVGTVNRRFPGKEALIEALIAERFEGLRAAATEALEHPDAWAGFEQFMRYSAEVMDHDANLSELMDSRPEMMGGAAQEVGMLDVMEPLVRRAQQAGQLRADFDAMEIPALICGLGRAIRPPQTDHEPLPDHPKPSMSWERYLEIILDGLRVR